MMLTLLGVECGETRHELPTEKHGEHRHQHQRQAPVA
jgi:hypothetical protein